LNKTVTVREYAQLTIGATPSESLDVAHVTASAFDHLCKLNASFKKSGAALLQLDGRQSLKLDNYVGVIQTPCGTTLEILPKTTDEADGAPASRALLQKMIQAALKLKTRIVGKAALDLFDAPISEWVMGQFLEALEHLIKCGLRFEYQRIEEEQPYLRGQLNTLAQLRQPPSRRHHFQIRHDVYLPDRPENRLLKTALLKVCAATRLPSHWLLAHELRSRLSEIPQSDQTEHDFRQWRNDRLMAQYRDIKPWCEIILSQQMPLALSGDWQGLSMLFPMEKLFEKYVEALLPTQLASDAQLLPQRSSKFLCLHKNRDLFQLKPDLMVKHPAGYIGLLDAKWKRLDSNNIDKNYGLSQSDFYQMFAYGTRYLESKGELVLIYPMTSRFKEPLSPFIFSDLLKLHVLPFDLDKQKLIGIETTQLPRR